jgi:hypothetical protein
LLALVLIGQLLPRVGSTAITDEAGFLYCLDDDGVKIFAGRKTLDGSLRFGVSVWSPTGQNISVFGSASKTADGWEFSENPQAGAASERCRVDIVRDADGAVRVTADPDASCQDHGGNNAEIGAIHFPRTSYQGPVTIELNDPEAFQKTTRCARTKL